MKTMSVAVLLSVAFLSATLSARAGEKGGMRDGPIGKILEHAKELGLTDEQTKKLEALKTELRGKMGGGMEKLREVAQSDPKLREELKEARGNPEKMKEVMQKVREKTGGAGAGNGPRGELIEKLKEILTPDQLVKVKAILEEGREKGAGGRGQGGKAEPKGAEPDRNSAPPKVFE